MAQETLGYINLEWNCPNCGVKNPGPQKVCSGCGSPQPDNVEFHQPDQSDFITDENEIKKIEAGPDIHCGFCGARNAATNLTCTQCGANLKEGKQRQSGQVIGAFENKPGVIIKCQNCGADNPQSAGRCQKCGAPIQTPRMTAQSQPKRSGASKLFPFLLILPIILIAICGIVIFLSLLRTGTTIGTVESVSWTRSITIEKLTDVTKETWKDEVPAGAKIGACTLKYHHTQNEPIAGAEKVCGTPYTIDTGTGQGKVVQDCQYKVSKDYCKYTIQEWQKVDEVINRGTDFNPKDPPEPKISSGQRLGVKYELYTINFTSEKANYKYTTKNVDEFKNYTIGSKWELTINALNSVTNTKPIR